MAKRKKADFSGYATKNNLKCGDGRVIRRDAFKDNDGQKVPLVWQHMHDTPDNVLGHALLENRKDGVYVYCYLNDSPAGTNAKTLVTHGDITDLSIYANKLVQKGKDVVHGVIKEISLVLSGANPGALIDNVSIVHSDGTQTDLEDEAIIYSGLNLDSSSNDDDLEHADDDDDDDIVHADDDATVGGIFDSMTEEQKNVVYAMIAELMSGGDDDAEHSDLGGNNRIMKQNVFDQSTLETEEPTLSHDDFKIIIDDAMNKYGSLKQSVIAHDAMDAFVAHAGTYGIDNMDYLFPDAKAIRPTPDLYKRDTEWVGSVMSGTHHSPFSRIKSMSVDLTTEEARALGYVTGDLKVEEVIALAKRVTTPQTIYKKQKLDRDDIIDVTTMDVVAWLKMEMRMMLDEEIARAVLISDGRLVSSDYKIVETNVRPIYTDDDAYTIKHQLGPTDDVEDLTDAFIEARATYKGSGNPVAFVAPTTLTELLLQKDTLGHRLYKTVGELAAALRVSRVIEVPLMEGLSRTPDATEYTLKAIVVNLKDYTIGADKGGQTTMFDDFDIDYNQYKYLLETRISGCLTRLYSAIVIEQEVAA